MLPLEHCARTSACVALRCLALPTLFMQNYFNDVDGTKDRFIEMKARPRATCTMHHATCNIQRGQ
jgi:hypothetical protein